MLRNIQKIMDVEHQQGPAIADLSISYERSTVFVIMFRIPGSDPQRFAGPHPHEVISSATEWLLSRLKTRRNKLEVERVVAAAKVDAVDAILDDPMT